MLSIITDATNTRLCQRCPFALGLTSSKRRLPRHPEPLKYRIQPRPLRWRRTRRTASQRLTHVPHCNLHLGAHPVAIKPSPQPIPLARLLVVQCLSTAPPAPRAPHQAAPRSAAHQGLPQKTPQSSAPPPVEAQQTCRDATTVCGYTTHNKRSAVKHHKPALHLQSM